MYNEIHLFFLLWKIKYFSKKKNIRAQKIIKMPSCYVCTPHAIKILLFYLNYLHLVSLEFDYISSCVKQNPKWFIFLWISIASKCHSEELCDKDVTVVKCRIVWIMCLSVSKWSETNMTFTCVKVKWYRYTSRKWNLSSLFIQAKAIL